MTVQKLKIGGERVTIRPMSVADVGLETEFIRALSPRARHYRFLAGIRELSAAEVLQLCSVDGRHSMAYVATIQRQGRAHAVGVSRYAPNAKSDVREIAVTVADEWQDRGLDRLLMQHLIESARRNGVKRLHSVDLNDNAAMRSLAGHLRMRAQRDPGDPHQTIYSLSL
jgi:GNAT superfamily N-acetyltransferase